MRERLESYFEFERLRTTWRTEILAGFTTFFTMAYIVFVNPSILRDAGMPFAAVLAATCVSAGLGSILMGAFARYPIALAPGMGLNAYFTYTVVMGMGVNWQTALGAVFLSGIAFLILTITGASRIIVDSIPHELYSAVACGIGLFIAMIGLRNAGIIVASPATLVQLGNLREPNTLLAIFGLLITAILHARGIRAAIIVGILLTTAAGALFGLVQWTPQSYSSADLSVTIGQLDIAAASRLGLLEVVFVFLFVDVFDNVGTLVGVTKRAGLVVATSSDTSAHVPRIKRILIADSAATIAGAFAGTSTVVSYIESAAGVVAGGRTGVTAIVTGLLFIVALFVAPLVGAVPQAATAPALIVVGSLMMSHAGEIPWSNAAVAIPAFLTILTIPLTFSIATGLSFGFTAYALLKLARGQFQKDDWLVYVLAALFIARFVYLGQA
jgi:AGZA family xanthine/uracil permease-like MFS transporter